MIFVFWIYWGLRTFHADFDRNYILVKWFEMEDAHMEVEILTTMVQDPGKSHKFRKNFSDLYGTKLMHNNYINVDNTHFVIMGLFNALVVF